MTEPAVPRRYYLSPADRAARSERMRRMNADPEMIARRAASWRAHLADREFLARRGEAIRAGWEKSAEKNGLIDDEHRELYRLARRKGYGRAEAIEFARKNAKLEESAK